MIKAQIDEWLFTFDYSTVPMNYFFKPEAEDGTVRSVSADDRTHAKFLMWASPADMVPMEVCICIMYFLSLYKFRRYTMCQKNSGMLNTRVRIELQKTRNDLSRGPDYFYVLFSFSGSSQAGQRWRRSGSGSGSRERVKWVRRQPSQPEHGCCSHDTWCRRQEKG